MTEPLKPALTPEEWKAERLNNEYVVCEISGDMRGRGLVIGARPWLNDAQQLGKPVQWLVSADTARGIAALALHVQSFGFTHEDLAALDDALADMRLVEMEQTSTISSFAIAASGKATASTSS